MNRPTRSRRWMAFAGVGALAAGAVLMPSGAFAGDCDGFPGGVCPAFSDHRKPPEFGDIWWNVKSARTDDLVAEETGGGFRVRPRADRENQLFRFLKSSEADAHHGPVYQIQVMPKVPPPVPDTPMCLEGSDGGQHGAGVHTNPCEETGSQFWEIEPHPKGFFRIRRGTGSMRCLDAHNPPMTPPPPETHLQEWTCHDRENQAWTFVTAPSQPKVWDPGPHNDFDFGEWVGP
ncbi:RICIN domain-containing protein [Streptomyces sp. IBSNAI002]|uniref:RICIN domain-containing protein n=1 Tax=Streptomyces sp. IBSNAI002 TaxID=3457500 RepID=UPI003FD56128